MADAAAADAAACAAPERSRRAALRRPSQLSIRHDAEPEGAGSGSATDLASEDERVERVQVRKRVK